MSLPVFKTSQECRVELAAKTTLAGTADACNDEGWYSYLNDLDADFLPVSAARASFGKEDKTGADEEADINLLKFLADNRHVSVFEHSYATFLIECPLFVRSQIIRHRSFTFNEMSRRYTSEDIGFWVPDRWRKQSKSNKQGSTDVEVDITVNRHSDPVYVKYHNIKARVTRMRLPFDLSINDIQWVAECPILGIPLNYSLGRGKIMDDSPSIDRIDPTKGYTKDNVRIVSSKANTMKSNATEEELVRFAEDVLLTYKGHVVKEEDTYEGLCRRSARVYQSLLEDGCSREQARAVLPQSLLTRFYMTGNLRSYWSFLSSRLKEDTQMETRVVAERIKKELDNLWPESMKALFN